LESEASAPGFFTVMLIWRLPVDLPDLGGPWTSDKVFVECQKCKRGPGVFVYVRDLFGKNEARPVHKHCLEAPVSLPPAGKTQ
jgi:hypothetical protein